MARHTVYDRHSRTQKRSAMPAVLLAVGGGVLTLVLAVAAVVVYVKASPVATKTDPATKTYTLEEFKALVIGKTPDEVIAAVGKPDDVVNLRNDDNGTWSYYKRVKNPITDKYGWTNLQFEDGKVASIRQ